MMQNIFLYKQSLKKTPKHVQSDFLLLSRAEQQRAQQFKFQKDRDRFVIARAELRKILSKQCAVEPEALHFSENKYGKPFLPDFPTIHFNVSHANDLAMYAVSDHCEVGIDVEYISRDIDISGIAQRFFAKEEYAYIEQDQFSIESFFSVWTAKEAVVKCLGTGLSVGLNEFCVLPEDEQHWSIRYFNAYDHLLNLRVKVWSPEKGYIAALMGYR